MAFYEHLSELAGKKVVEFQPQEPLPDPANFIPRLFCEYDSEFSGVDLLNQLLQDPRADQLSGIVIGTWDGEMGQVAPSDVIELLVASAPRLASLTTLFVGDITGDECEVSWLNQCDQSPIWNAFPNLEYFAVRGTGGLRLGKLEHAALKTLIVQGGGLPKEVTHEVCQAKLPSLEHLELYIGDAGYGCDTELADLQPILSGTLFPKLQRLGLRNCEFADQIAEAIVQSPLIKQLKVLDLSLGTLGDAGGAALLACEAVRELDALVLHHHYLSDEMAAQLSALPIKVDVSDPEGAVEPEERFVAIGE